MNKPERKTNYQTFYKDAIQNRQGYVTRDGTWAAVPIMGSKQFAIIHNGELLYNNTMDEFRKQMKAENLTAEFIRIVGQKNQTK